MLEKTVSRREFLKKAGIAGAALGAGAGLSGLIVACGGEETTTTAAGASTSTTAAGETTTSVSTAAEAGRPLKVGFVSPVTGKLATFGTADKYVLDRWNEYAKDGIVCGDKKNHPVEIILQDSQSSSDRASHAPHQLNELLAMM